MDVFVKEDKEYKQHMDPFEDYLKTMVNYLKKKYDLPQEELEKYVKDTIKKNNPRNPTVKFNKKDRNGDMNIETTKLTSYLREVKEDDDIIVPTFTTYINHEKRESLHSVFITINKNARAVDKKKAFHAKLKGDMEAYNYFNTTQSKRKTTNNSLSGAYASNGTILFNESGHSTLTSITRCVSGIGNAISEIVVGGNRYFRTPESLINYLLTVIKHSNLDLVEEVIKEYNIYIPTEEEVFEKMMFSARWYWTSLEKEEEIKNIIKNLSDRERVAVVYTNDMWSVKDFNQDLTKELIDGISFPCKDVNYSKNPLEDLKEEFEGTDNLVRYIFANEIKGRILNYEEMLKEKDPLVFSMASTSKQVKETLFKFSKFFKAFFLTDILPPNVAYIQDMFRLNIVLSDTDSTCCAYDKWVEWYYGDKKDLDRYVGVAGGIMTITTQLIAHNLKVFYHNLNIRPKYGNLLQMKNEYFWPVFVTSNKSKHYFASTMIREGNVYTELEREKKGVHFISSTYDKVITDTTNYLMDYITNTVGNNDKISLKHMCTTVANIERKIYKDFNENQYYMFKRDSIKNAKAYKNGPLESKYVYHLLWNEIFGEKYGLMDEPPYTIYNIPLEVENKTDFDDLKAMIQGTDEEVYKKFDNITKKYNKTNISTMRIPKLILDRHGIPVELKDKVAIRKTIRQMCYSLYEVLTTIGFYKKEEQLMMDLGF